MAVAISPLTLYSAPHFMGFPKEGSSFEPQVVFTPKQPVRSVHILLKLCLLLANCVALRLRDRKVKTRV